jgi:hypothetical protein
MTVFFDHVFSLPEMVEANVGVTTCFMQHHLLELDSHLVGGVSRFQ